MEEGGAGDRIRIRMIEMKGFENPRRRQIHDRLVTDEDWLLAVLFQNTVEWVQYKTANL